MIFELLPLCNEQLVIVMDNASFYAHPSIAEAVEACDYLVRYLLPYSHDYNPIELTFYLLKAWIRRFFDRSGQPL